MKIIIDALRSIFGFIDKHVYNLVEGVFQLILDLANVEIFSGSQITKFANRLYIILGLVMIFKLMISFIQIIVNPDKMDDKEQGVGNILKRVVISLALIVLVPSIFDMARTIQNYVVPVIPRVILGGQTAETTIEDAGRTMALQSFFAFYGYDNPSCNDGSILGIGTTQSNNVTIASIDAAVASSNLNKIDTCSNDPNGYKYRYVILASTALAIYLLYTLISMAVYVAIRSIKLAVCEFIAPIPIASYIDPKTSKQSFDNWVKTSFSTYLDLFVNLIGIYFIAYVFSILFDSATITTIYSKVGGDTSRAAWITVFIIVALLKFGKEFPKFITGLLGLKEGGSLAGILKGSTALGLAGTALAAVGSGYGSYKYAKKNGEGGLKAVQRGLGSLGGATRRGLVATAKDEGWKGAYQNNIKATTGASHRKVNARFMAKQSQLEYEKMVSPYEETYKNAVNAYNDEIKRIKNDTSMSASEKTTAMKTAEETLNNARDARNTAVSRIPKPIRPMQEKVMNAVNRWQGLDTPTGSSYTSAASTLANLREKFFTGEAMKKLDEEGSKLNNVFHGYGNFDYTDKDGNKVEADSANAKELSLNYSQVRKAYDQLMNGSYDGKIEDSKGNTYEVDASKIREMFSSAQKYGAVDYLNATVGRYDKDGNYVRGVEQDDGSLKTIENTAMTEMEKQVMGVLDGLGIETGLKKQLQLAFRENPGKFYRELSDVIKQLETSGGRRSSYEQNQEKKD